MMALLKKYKKRKSIWKIQNYIIDDPELIAVQKIEPNAQKQSMKKEAKV